MSLFGNFFERIKGSAEFLASESLNYILNNAQKANENLIQLINRDNNSEYSMIRFSSQVQGDKLEIPDISGFNKDEEEVIIIETKFWASLTSNQPGTYLERLVDNGILVFVCPEQRTISLEDEIIHALKGKCEQPANGLIKTENKTIIIYSWKTILDNLEKDIDNSDFEIRSDINQLTGLCERVDSESFLPITEKDMSPEIPRRILSYNSIVDKVIDCLVKDNILSTKGLKATPEKWGYRRYAFNENLTISVDVNFEKWARNVDTPIWLEISEQWKVTPLVHTINNEIEKKYERNYGPHLGRPYYPIRLHPGDVEDKIIQGIVSFIKKVCEIYNENK